MAEVVARAVVMGPVSGSDSTYTFKVDDDFFGLPADDIVERFIDHLHEAGDLPERNAYELNSAFKNRERNVVTALGNLYFANEEMPFVVMIHQQA